MSARLKKENEALLAESWRLYPHTFAHRLSKGKWKQYRHLVYLGERLARAIARGNARIVISMPPRHGKSELTSKWAVLWFLSLFPDKNVILTSYEAEYAASWGRKVRDLMLEHQHVLDVKLRKDSTAVDRWNTTEGGGMMTAGMGGALTGKGADLLVIDDPVKNWQDAQSKTIRQRHIDWFKSTAHSRLEPGGSCIIIQTRWHERDLAGWVLSKDNDMDEEWLEIKLPALAEEGDPLGRELDEPLCPERFPLEKLLSIRGNGGMIWNALWQQRPSAQSGNVWKRAWFANRWKVLPEFDAWLMSADCTFKDTDGSDYVAIGIWGKKGADKYLVWQSREQMDIVATMDEIKRLAVKFPKCRRKLVEDKANGPAVISMLKKKVAGLIPVEPMGDKVARANACAPEWEAGNVYVPDPTMPGYEWVADYIEECVSFPNAPNDDQVDQTSQALNDFASGDVDWLRKINSR